MILLPFLIVCLVPLVWAISIKYLFSRDITISETVGVFVIGMVVTFAGLKMSVWSQVRDVQILNGSVTDKKSKLVSCEHDYQCRCTTDSKGNRSCDTCYEHISDTDWIVYSDVGYVEIPRVDRQGRSEPPRFTSAIVGEPFAYEDTYSNYVLGARNSLFSDRSESKVATPSYGSVFDYYRFNHVTAHGISVPNLNVWNKELSVLLQTLGAEKQVNVNLVFTNSDVGFADALETAWAGGKKNDVTVVVGVKHWPKVDWVQAFTFARTKNNAAVAIEIRNAFMMENALGDPHAAVQTLGSLIRRHYNRVPMQEFEYLAREITPSVLGIVLTLISVLLVLFVATHIFRNNGLRTQQSRRFR